MQTPYYAMRYMQTLYYVVYYMQGVHIMLCVISILLCSVLYAECPYYVVRYMHVSGGLALRIVPRPLRRNHPFPNGTLWSSAAAAAPDRPRSETSKL